MRITQGPQGEILLRRENGPRYYRDSTLLYHAAILLRTMGADVIRKDAGKDGNLTSEGSYYLRDRKRNYCWHYPQYQLRFLYQDYNEDKVCLLAEGEFPVLTVPQEAG